MFIYFIVLEVQLLKGPIEAQCLCLFEGFRLVGT